MQALITNSVSIWRPIIGQPNSLSSSISLMVRTGLVTTLIFQAFSRVFSSLNALSLLPLIVISLYNIEKYRSAKALDSLAVNSFLHNYGLNKDEVQRGVINYLSLHPSAVKQLIAQPGFNIRKTDYEDGKTLFQHSMELLSNDRISFEEEKDCAATIKLLLETGKISQEELFIYISKPDSNSWANRKLNEILLCAVEKEIIKPGEFTAAQIHFLGTNFSDSQFYDLLVTKGLYVDAKNSKQETAILSLFKKHFGCDDCLEKIIALLHNGATLPKDDTLIEIERRDELVRKPFRALLEKDPSLSMIVDNARRIPKNAYPKDFSSRFISLMPAIEVGGKYKKFEVSHHTLFIRVMLLACPIITGLSIICSFTLFPTYPLVFSAVALGILNRFEWSRAVKALNRIAIDQFQKSAVTKSILVHIAKDKALVDQVIDGKLNLTATDERGQTLWDVICKPDFLSFDEIDFETRFANFKRLADQFFDDTVFLKLRHAFFLNVIESGHYQFVHFLLENNKMRLADFTDANQFACWTHLKDPETLKVLHQYGFNPNVKDDKGFTPLLWIARAPFLHCISSGLTPYLYVKGLLEAYADPRVTVVIEEEVNNVKVSSRITALELIQRHRDLGPIAKLLKDRLRAFEQE